MKGYLLIEYGRDGNNYQGFVSHEAAKKKFAKVIRQNYGVQNELVGRDDIEDMIEDGYYAPKGELKLEIEPFDINLDDYDRQKRIETVFCNAGEENFPEDDGAIRLDKDEEHVAVVWEPFVEYYNRMLANYIEKGQFDD